MIDNDNDTNTNNPRSDNVYPLLPTRQEVLLPGVLVPLEVGRKASIAAVERALADDSRRLVIVPQRDPDQARPKPGDLVEVGVLAEIVKVARLSAQRLTIAVKTLARVRVEEIQVGEAGWTGITQPLVLIVPDDAPASVQLIADVREQLGDVMTRDAENPAQIRGGLGEISDPDDLIDIAAAHMELSRDLLVSLLVEPTTVRRLELVMPELRRQAEVLRVKATIRAELDDSHSGERRDELLRERMRQIQEELGEVPSDSEYEQLRTKIDAAQGKMPDAVRQVARKQATRLRDMGGDSQEANVARTYLTWLLDLPWGQYTTDTLDIAAARAILNADHAGLEKVKKRVLEYLAVRKLAPDKNGPILCLVGPPGVGKTSLGRSIASALGRSYVRVSLGGVRDESEIRGHRRTYIGALPGRIASGLKKAGSMNPVFVLDEIDKMAAGVRGDPASAMLEVLDPEQNNEFVDHYLEVPLDLSKIMFVTTANQLDTIPGPLLDRMEVIYLPGYTAEEKRDIAKGYLIPRQLAEHGIEKGQLSISDEVIDTVIASYTREAGVRNLERELATLCRGAAVRIASKEVEHIDVVVADLDALLGPPRFFAEVAGSEPQVGVSTGLAWTPTGGDVLFIEARTMPGTGALKQTGQLGDVMSESVHTAFSYVRSHVEELGLDQELLKTSDIHLHLPSGGIKKDGPSAGVAIATALVSILSDRPIRSDVAMTGEITLRGLVLPVGGIKEKLLAAHRAGCRTIVIPERNRKDLYDIPQTILDDLDIHFASRAPDAFAVAFAGSEGNRPKIPAPAAPIPPVSGRDGGKPVGDQRGA